MSQRAVTDHTIHELLAERWSPIAYEPRELPEEFLGSLFEAARWAPSCYNDQPWHFLIARRQQTEQFERMLDCLVEGNRVWARNASVLAITVVRTSFQRNRKPNSFAAHDLGLAVGNLLVQATELGLIVHQMGGFDVEQARSTYGIPDGFEPMTAIAIGYRGDPSTLTDEQRQREEAPRERKPLASFVFAERWDSPAGF